MSSYWENEYKLAALSQAPIDAKEVFERVVSDKFPNVERLFTPCECPEIAGEGEVDKRRCAYLNRWKLFTIAGKEYLSVVTGCNRDNYEDLSNLIRLVEDRTGIKIVKEDSFWALRNMRWIYDDEPDAKLREVVGTWGPNNRERFINWTAFCNLAPASAKPCDKCKKVFHGEEIKHHLRTLVKSWGIRYSKQETYLVCQNCYEPLKEEIEQWQEDNWSAAEKLERCKRELKAARKLCRELPQSARRLLSPE